jgi:hypothetical protein
MKKRSYLSGILCAFATLSASADSVNLLQNPGFESGLDGWQSNGASTRDSDPSPYEGNAYLIGGWGNGGLAGNTTTTQAINLLDYFTADQLDSGGAVDFGGWQSGWHDQQDSGQISLACLDASGNQLATDSLGWFHSYNLWTEKESLISLPAGTRSIQYQFDAVRYDGGNNDAYLDDAFVYVTVNAVPEPSSAMLTMGGLALLLAKAKHRV